jgi:lysophospholipase
MRGAIRTDLIATDDNPIPQGADCRVLTTADGVELRFAFWPSGVEAARGSVALLQGRAEFIEKYFEMIEHFRQRGFSVIAFDWRGQGGSQRLARNPGKGHVWRFSDYHDDLAAIFLAMRELAAAEPWFAVAHSMGAAILLDRLVRGPIPVARSALCSPMIGLSRDIAPHWAEVGASALSRIGFGRIFIPGGRSRSIATKPFNNNRLSSDSSRYARNAGILTAAPELGVGDPTVRWLATAYRAMNMLADPSFPPKIKAPLLILASGADRVVSTQVTERFAARLKTGEAIVIRGARHELMMERDFFRDQALAALDAFIPGGDEPLQGDNAGLIAGALTR